MINHVFFAAKKRLSAPRVVMAMLLGAAILPAQADNIILTPSSGQDQVVVLPTQGDLSISSMDSSYISGAGNVVIEGGTMAIYNQLNAKVYFGGQSMMGDGDLVFDLILSANSVGQTYTVSSGAQFDQAVQLLTNGINDNVSYEVDGSPGGGGIGIGSSEAGFFFGDDTGAHGVDFAGYQINSISLTVNSLNLSTPGSNPNGDGVWTDAKLNATLKINTVPVPAAMWLFGSGLLGLTGVARRNKTR